MRIYLPLHIKEFIDNNKGCVSRETLMIKMLAYIIEEGIDIEKVKERRRKSR